VRNENEETKETTMGKKLTRRSRKVVDVVARAANAMGQGHKTVHRIERGLLSAQVSADGTIYVYSGGQLQQKMSPDGSMLYPGSRPDLDCLIAEALETAPSEIKKILRDTLNPKNITS
jgi:hypothetical protein